MNKKEFGKKFYLASLIICVVALILAWILLPVTGLEGDKLTQIWMYRYAVVFLCLAFVVPTGCVVREICYGDYNKKMLITKIIIVIASSILGTVLILVLKNFGLSKILSFASILVLMFVANPNNKENNKNV